MKIALLMSGYSRTIETNICKLKKNVIQDNDVDIYLHKTMDENSDKYNNIVKWEKVVENLNPKIVIESSNVMFNKNKNINNIYNQFYKFYLLNKIKKDFEKNEKIRYDYMIKWRPDINIDTKINFEAIEKNLIYIPEKSNIDRKRLTNTNDKYLCDIIAYGENKIMTLYFDIFLQLNDLTSNYGYCQENLLYNYLHNNDIKYKKISIDYSIILSTCNIISISGNSGSGKTTLSKFLLNDISECFLLECDRYHKWGRGNQNWENLTHLNPEANYITKMQEDVFNLKIGKNIYQVDYDHITGKFTDKECIESKDTVIVCGLHSLYNSDSSIKIFMDTMEELNIIWKIKRDIKKRAYTVEKVLKIIQERKKDYIEYILPQKNKADIIINFYTDDKISFEDLNKNYNIKLNIYVKNKYNISFLLSSNNYYDIQDIENYYKIKVKNELQNYYENIKYIIQNLNTV